MGLYVAQVSPSAGSYTLGSEVDQQITSLLKMGTGLTDQASKLAVDFKLSTLAAAAPPTIPVPVFAPYVPGTLTVANLDSPGNAPNVTPPVVPTSSYALGTAPTDTLKDPVVSFPAVPTVTRPELHDAPTDIEAPALPSPITITLPNVPTLRQVNLPPDPSVIIPSFSSDNPSSSVPNVASPSFDWNETDYRARLPDLQSKVSTLLKFDFDAAEVAIWQLGQDRSDRIINEAKLKLSNDFAARGLALPSGSMLAAQAELVAKGTELKFDNARNAMIKAAELNVQKLTAALQTGLQLETQWMDYESKLVQRQFEAAKMNVEIFMKVTDAEISLFNARVQAYATDAQVYREKIQAELSKVEVFKAKLEGQKLVGELNMQDVEVYKAMFQGVMANIEVYKAQISAVVAELDFDKVRVEVYASEVNAFKTRVDANVAEYNAWAEQMRGEAVKAQVYDTSVRAFGARVEAYKAAETTKIEADRLLVSRAELNLKGYEASLQGYDTYVKGYMAKVAGISANNTAAAQAYGAISTANLQAAQVNVSVSGQAIDAAKANAMTSMEHAHKLVIEAQEWAKLQIEGAQGAAKVYAQLAASALSAVHFSENFSTQASLSNSLSESYNASI